MSDCLRSSGLVPKVSPFFRTKPLFIDNVFRCITRLSGLKANPSLGGGPTMVPRSLEHTTEALKVYELRELWEKYGLVGDLVVCTSVFAT